MRIQEQAQLVTPGVLVKTPCHWTVYCHLPRFPVAVLYKPKTAVTLQPYSLLKVSRCQPAEREEEKGIRGRSLRGRKPLTHMCLCLCVCMSHGRGRRGKEVVGWNKGEYGRTGDRSQRDFSAIVRVLGFFFWTLSQTLLAVIQVGGNDQSGSLKGVTQGRSLAASCGPVLLPWAQWQIRLLLSPSIRRGRSGWHTLPFDKYKGGLSSQETWVFFTKARAGGGARTGGEGWHLQGSAQGLLAAKRARCHNLTPC